MSSAIDVFREQREAADQVHARLTEISALLHQLRHQISALTINDELRAVLRQEQSWLERAQVVLSQVRSFREQDALRSWPGVVRRWVLALAFALAPPRGPATRGRRNGTLQSSRSYEPDWRLLRSSSVAWSR